LLYRVRCCLLLYSHYVRASVCRYAEFYWASFDVSEPPLEMGESLVCVACDEGCGRWHKFHQIDLHGPSAFRRTTTPTCCDTQSFGWNDLVNTSLPNLPLGKKFQSRGKKSQVSHRQCRRYSSRWRKKSNMFYSLRWSSLGLSAVCSTRAARPQGATETPKTYLPFWLLQTRVHLPPPGAFRSRRQHSDSVITGDGDEEIRSLVRACRRRASRVLSRCLQRQRQQLLQRRMP